jgi:opacity protein-like surface antigen
MICRLRISARRARNFVCRIAILGACLAALAPARAADMPGFGDWFIANPAVAQWSGFVGGAQVGVSNLSSDFGNATSSLVAYALRNTLVESEFAPENWTALPKSVTNSRQYGFFLGYNTQWNRLVLGADASYIRPASLAASASDSISRIVTTSDKTQHTVSITSAASLKLIDYATVRARAGYAIGQFLPYATVGLAVGRFDYAASAIVVDTYTLNGVPVTYAPPPQTDAKNGAFSAGVGAGLGVDVALLPNVFVRAEWEYIAFAPVSGIRSQLNTGRVGLGLKF